MLRISCRHGHRKENNWQGSAAQVVANTRVNVSAGTFLMGSTKRVDRNEYLTEIRLAIRRRELSTRHGEPPRHARQPLPKDSYLYLSKMSSIIVPCAGSDKRATCLQWNSHHSDRESSMRTNDPDRCPSGHDVYGDQLKVVQCQGGLHHGGAHYFHEDHYTVQWHDDLDTSMTDGSEV